MEIFENLEKNIELTEQSKADRYPKRRVVADLKTRNANNGKAIAGEYYGGKYTYDQTFSMFNDYKKGFISLEGAGERPIVISAPSTIATINSFYGAMDANKIVFPVGPGFLNAFTNEFTEKVGAVTVVVYDGFLSEDLIEKLHKSGVKNVVVTSITDYMSPIVKFIGVQKGILSNKDFLDEYVKSGKKLPPDMQFIRMREFAKTSSKIKYDPIFPYEEDKIGMYILTGATTSRIPKAVKVYADGFIKMAEIYGKTWFDFKPKDRNAVFIPIFYATGVVHSIHAGLFSGSTNIYLPKYDRFAFGSDLKKSKAKIALVAPSHVATLRDCGLKKDSLNHVEYVFIGGEAVVPSQIEDYRDSAKSLGIKHVYQGYGMTEDASMTGLSPKESDKDDSTVVPLPEMEYRIVDPITRAILGDNQRGIIEMKSPCVMAGYLDESLNNSIFTSDGWIHTGDVAIRYSNGRYRIFGRYTDSFVYDGRTYFLFDIEEEILKCPGVAEAEVTKLTASGRELPAIVIVVKKEWENRLKEILCFIASINIPGIEFSIGTRFIDNFKTNPVTAKRDYLSLPSYKDGYYKMEAGHIFQTDIDSNDNLMRYEITDEEIAIQNTQEPLTRKLK